MTEYVKICQDCKTERPQYELYCEYTREDGMRCEFPLIDAGLVLRGMAEPAQTVLAPGGGQEAKANGTHHDAAPAASTPIEPVAAPDPTPDGTCPSCHADVEPDDAACLACGTALGLTAPRPQAPERQVADWLIVAELPAATPEAELFLVRRKADDPPSLLRMLPQGVNPDAAIYSVLEAIDHARIPHLLAHGRFEDRAFEVWENIDGPTLAELAPALARNDATIEHVAGALIGALTLFERRGLRHGNLQPAVIRQRHASQLTLAITDFSTASIAEFDVEADRQRTPNRYMSPEAVASASTSGSDWWSLGIVLLELLTRGACFKDINDRAFMLHVVSRGVAIPETLPPRWRNLLKGLLTRNHEKRWKSDQALQWLTSEQEIPTGYEEPGKGGAEGKPFLFAGRNVTSPADLALLAAQESNWDEARGLLDRGEIATWLATFDAKQNRGESYDLVSRIGSDSRLGPDQKLALALAAMNRDLPLCVKGTILTAGALQADLGAAAQWLSAPVLATLRKLKRDRDRWILQIAERADRVRARAKEAHLEIDEETFPVLRLATSAAALEARWAKQRPLFPDSGNATLASLIERRSPSDEDLLLLLSVRHQHFKPLEGVLREAEALVKEREGEPSPVPEFTRASATTLLAQPRSELVDELNARIPGFERCKRVTVDEWVDSFRSANRRMPLARLLATLAVPSEEWQEPPEQDYVRSVLGHMHRRVLAGIQKGALVQMRGTAGNIDLHILGHDQLDTVLNAVVARSGQEQRLVSRSANAASFFENVRALNNKAGMFHRDTGMEALYVGFPFLTLLDRTEDSDRTRIAPLLLWPVKLNVAGGATGAISIASDPAREVAVNPALETILGAAQYERWSETINTAIRDGFDSRDAVLRALSDVVEGEHATTIEPIPKASSVRRTNIPEIRAAAALFLAEFPSQAIANDLKALQQRPLEGTALQCLMRLGEPRVAGVPLHVPQIESFGTLEADPSQEHAVARSRLEPGLVVQGPPGTGKSQTIVNIITDCLGRGESVVVVCEKKAALDVVQKRLTAEGLGDRVVRVENTTTDRSSLINSLRTQVHAVRADAVNHAPPARQKRIPIASKIDAIETGLDAYHEAVHTADERLGLSYREVLSLIAAQNVKAKGLSAPALRRHLGPLTITDLESTIGACAGLIDVWLSGGMPGKLLSILKPFAVDQAQAEGIAARLEDLLAADAQRMQGLAERKVLPEQYRTLTSADNAALSHWLQHHGNEISEYPAKALARCTSWRPLFSSRGALREDGKKIKNALSALITSLDGMALSGQAQTAHGTVVQWPEADIAALAAALPVLRQQPTLLGFLNLVAAMQRRTAHKILVSHSVAAERSPILAHAEAASFETGVRSRAKDFRDLATQLAHTPELLAVTQRGLITKTHALAQEINEFERFANQIDACPVSDMWLHVCAAAEVTGIGQPLAALIEALATAQKVADSRAQATNHLSRLDPYLEPETLRVIASAFSADAPTGLDTAAIRTALPVMVPFQTFRLRSAELSQPARATFSDLEPVAQELGTDAERTARQKIEAIMRREAACAWKDAIETERPLLKQLQGELIASISELEGLDGKIRDANRKLLAVVDREKIRDTSEWSPTWATGPATKRLRQVFKLGSDIGLLQLRPVWLVNPDVASRMLPLEPGLFDIAIFDEASQMRVVNALPALYRAKRCVVSGDEKQLPPTSFFGSRADSADGETGDDPLETYAPDGELDSIDEDAEAAPRFDPRALQIAERHIKDCEDLLALSRGHLPETSLDIHYRSQYRELIAFSNAAYYGGRLNVPVRKSPAEVLRAKPIVVVRVDGTYKNQTNSDEADAVVDYLAKLWSREANPPTVGVVTFNMKQAECIQSRLDQRADQDKAFGKALLRERTRKAQGEDVGFFVKNLENVQGDERDWIIFSTTFGRDENDVFKRAFGALNQQGGERRLNVAVTRAKQKVVIVTSMPVSEISDALGSSRPPVRARDYLQIYMQYAELVSSGDMDSAIKLLEMFGPADLRAPAMHQAEPDELIVQAQACLLAEGFEAHLLPREDAFSLDIAVTEPESSSYILGVEFDSPRHHLLRHARAREVWRPKLLARSGLRLHRISSAEWVRNPDAERARLIIATREALKGAKS